ncbi:MAG: hypothetical protein GQ564_15720 [Bacteroidales bacterium]|nr:hypothetical protein [Bacteroidales bacterium]
MKLLLLTIVFVLIAVLGLSVRLIFSKKGTFRGGSCQNKTDNLNGFSCDCSNEELCD